RARVASASEVIQPNIGAEVVAGVFIRGSGWIGRTACGMLQEKTCCGPEHRGRQKTKGKRQRSPPHPLSFVFCLLSFVFLPAQEVALAFAQRVQLCRAARAYPP